FPDDDVPPKRTLRSPRDACGLEQRSRSTSKGAGDLSHLGVSRRSPAGILIQGAALTPGKPPCRAALGGQPRVVLPDFHTFGLIARTIAVGSLGGVTAAERSECDLAPVHLVDPATGVYNRHLLRPGIALVKGWQRMQGFVHRAGDARFEGRSAADAIKAALAD